MLAMSEPLEQFREVGIVEIAGRQVGARRFLRKLDQQSHYVTLQRDRLFRPCLSRLVPASFPDVARAGCRHASRGSCVGLMAQRLLRNTGEPRKRSEVELARERIG